MEKAGICDLKLTEFYKKMLKAIYRLRRIGWTMSNL